MKTTGQSEGKTQQKRICPSMINIYFSFIHTGDARIVKRYLNCINFKCPISRKTFFIEKNLFQKAIAKWNCDCSIQEVVAPTRGITSIKFENR